MAGLGWVHFSDTSRKQVMKIIELLGEQGAVDELGIGVIRNAFSNEMFNGITTIMTRAKYYYLTPYLFIDFLNNSKGKNIQYILNNEEMKLIENLSIQYGENASKERIIGHTVAKKNQRTGGKEDLVYKPSNIYWSGIKKYEIFKNVHSLSQLMISINNGDYQETQKFKAEDDNEGDDKEMGSWTKLFDVPYKKEWKKNLNINLTKAEAIDLRSKIIRTQKGKLIATILDNPKYIEEFLTFKKFHDFKNASFYNFLPKENQKTIETSIAFWSLLKGAHIRFNILIQTKQKDKDLIADFEKQYVDWETETLDSFEWEKFNQEYLWELTHSYTKRLGKTKPFVMNWIEALKNKKDLNFLDEIVKNQEIENKKERSKLGNNKSGEIYKKWVGIQSMDYRIFNAQAIIKDIYTALLC